MKNDFNRNKELAIIHAGKRKAGLSDENYRVLLESLTGQRSAANLTPAERHTVINKLEELGGETAARSATGSTSKKYPSQNRVKPGEDKSRLLWKIDQLLGELGKDRSYAMSILKQMLGNEAPSALEWATPEILNKLTASLIIHKARLKRRES